MATPQADPRHFWSTQSDLEFRRTTSFLTWLQKEFPLIHKDVFNLPETKNEAPSPSFEYLSALATLTARNHKVVSVTKLLSGGDRAFVVAEEDLGVVGEMCVARNHRAGEEIHKSNSRTVRVSLAEVNAPESWKYKDLADMPFEKYLGILKANVEDYLAQPVGSPERESLLHRFRTTVATACHGKVIKRLGYLSSVLLKKTLPLDDVFLWFKCSQPWLEHQMATAKGEWEEDLLRTLFQSSGRNFLDAEELSKKTVGFTETKDLSLFDIKRGMIGLSTHEGRMRYHQKIADTFCMAIFCAARLNWILCAQSGRDLQKGSQIEAMVPKHRAALQAIPDDQIREFGSILGDAMLFLASYVNLSNLFSEYISWIASSKDVLAVYSSTKGMEELTLDSELDADSVEDESGREELFKDVQDGGISQAVIHWMKLVAGQGVATATLPPREAPKGTRFTISLVQPEVNPEYFSQQGSLDALLQPVSEPSVREFILTQHLSKLPLRFTGRFHAEAMFISLKLLALSGLSHPSVSMDTVTAIKGVSLSTLAVSKRCCPICFVLVKVAAEAFSVHIEAPGMHRLVYPCVLPPWLPSVYADKVAEIFGGMRRRAIETLANLHKDQKALTQDRGSASPPAARRWAIITQEEVSSLSPRWEGRMYTPKRPLEDDDGVEKERGLYDEEDAEAAESLRKRVRELKKQKQ